MTYVYTPNFDTFMAAQRLHIRRTPRARFTFNFWQRFMPMVALCAIVLLVRDTVWHHFSYPAWLGGLLSATVGLGLLPLLTRPFQLRRLFRNLHSQMGGGRPIELEFTGTQLISRIPGRSEGRFESTAILRMEADESITVLYVAEKLFLSVPTPALPASEWEAIRAWMKPVT